MVHLSPALVAASLVVGVDCFSPAASSSSSSSFPAASALRRRRITASSNRNDAFLLHEVVSDTTQDERVSDPASMVYYDEFLDPDNPMGVVCARGVCVLPDDDGNYDFSAPGERSVVDRFLGSYVGPRLLLAFASVLYGTNFPLGAVMNDSLPPSAATSARMVLASLALSPFLFRLEGELAPAALLCGCFTALGYITQSLSLVDTSPATVAFLGAATVIVCPALEVLVNKKDMSISSQPQTWLAATLCILGVGVLELYDPTGATAASDAFSQVGRGDGLAILQAVGFGTSFFLTERMMTRVPGQALPITAVQVSVTALLCVAWSLSDGWIGSEGAGSYGLPAMFLDPTLRAAASAVAWTGLATTALNRFVETTALGRMGSAEASVILATEPLWASLFAALWLQEDFGANDYIGGALIVGACLATALKRDDFTGLGDFFGNGNDEDTTIVDSEGSF